MSLNNIRPRIARLARQFAKKVEPKALFLPYPVVPAIVGPTDIKCYWVPANDLTMEESLNLLSELQSFSYIRGFMGCYGTLSAILIDKDAFAEIKKHPVNIVFICQTEYGTRLQLKISDFIVEEERGGCSVDDLVYQTEVSFRAGDISNWETF